MRVWHDNVVVLGEEKQDIKCYRPQNVSCALTNSLHYYLSAPELTSMNIDKHWKKRRSNPGRLRRLSREGIVAQCEICHDWVSIADSVRDYARLDQPGWKWKGGPAIDATDDQRYFRRLILKLFLAPEGASCLRPRINDQVVASQFSSHRCGTPVLVESKFSEILRTHAPGLLPQQQIVKDLHAKGRIRTIEFYGRFAESNRKWMNQSHPIRQVPVYRNRTAALGHGWHRAASCATPNDRSEPTGHHS
ncbi:MAG: GNAT family N-acetyltransferase [Burkholderiales bacterium]